MQRTFICMSDCTEYHEGMPSAEQLLQTLVEHSLQFTWFEGDVTPVGLGHTTNWRTLPFAVVAQPVGGFGTLHLADGRHLRVNDREAFMVPGKVLHKADADTPQGHVSRWAHFTFTMFGSLDVLSLIDLKPVLPVAFGDRLGTISEELAKLKSESSDRILNTVCRRQELGFRMLSVFLEASTPNPNLFNLMRGLTRILPVLQFLENNLTQPFGREDLAGLVHLSPTRFHSVFKQITGLAPMEYVQHMRISKAQQLLVRSDLTIAEVGYQSGFGDPFHFSRLFKSAVGMSPKAYRQKLEQRSPFA